MENQFLEIKEEFLRLKSLGLNYGIYKKSWEEYLEELIYLKDKYIFDNILESEYQRMIDQGINIGKFHKINGGEENLGSLSWIIIQNNPEFIDNINQFLNNPDNLDEYRFDLGIIEDKDFWMIEKFYWDHENEFESFEIIRGINYKEEDEDLRNYIYLDFKSSYSLRNQFYEYIYENILYYLIIK